MSSLYVINPQVVEMYERGCSCIKIADAFGCAAGTVAVALKKAGLPMRSVGRPAGVKNPGTDAKLRAIRAMRSAGATYGDIESEIGMKAGTAQALNVYHGG